MAAKTLSSKVFDPLPGPPVVWSRDVRSISRLRPATLDLRSPLLPHVAVSTVVALRAVAAVTAARPAGEIEDFSPRLRAWWKRSFAVASF